MIIHTGSLQFFFDREIRVFILFVTSISKKESKKVEKFLS
jgi:hypothetical protein